ncbi:hypothetical protein TNCV_3416921 [Trichonephila clavipes]|nr:hypothetical protein TNCV_3416921 [Trichonephila clavipes]
MPFQAICDTESLLFGCSRDYYSAIGPCHPSWGVGDWRGDCIGHFFVDWMKGGQMLTIPRTQVSDCPILDSFPR